MPPRSEETTSVKTHHGATASDVTLDEQALWAALDPLAWHNSVTGDSVFAETYEFTAIQVEDTARKGGYDCIIEAGCGTGDIIGRLDTDLPCFGVDINDRFIDHCQKHHARPNMVFEELDILNLIKWWNHKTQGKYKKPLVICVNNTLNIMPKELRGPVIEQMLGVAGEQGRCLVTYWNGQFFSHAIMSYYMKNHELCGRFNVQQHVDWKNRQLVTPTGYSTHWMLPAEVQRLLRAYDVNVESIEQKMLLSADHMNCAGLAIFAWFTQAATSRSKSYYDSDDAQTFYSHIWGDETLHVGRYDLLTKQDKQLSAIELISKAEAAHEAQFIQRIVSKYQIRDETPKIRILDMGCGYGGLLRRLHEAGHVWRAVGCDISTKMCQQARRINAEQGAAGDIKILEESYLSVSVPDESQDLVISMDALLHIGPDGQHTAVREACRVLRPGGWMIFSDIMQHEGACPKAMKPIYDRIHLSKMGTVENYHQALDNCGFSNFSFEEFSPNVGIHYGTVRKALLEKKGDIPVSEAFLQRMEQGLSAWEQTAPNNIRWGFIMAQKTDNISEQ